LTPSAILQAFLGGREIEITTTRMIWGVGGDFKC